MIYFLFRRSWWRAFIALYILLLLMPACTNSNLDNGDYNFKKVSQMFKLKKELKEISGISFFNDTTLACVEDEKGVVYFYDIKNKVISDREKFKSKGDFEDIVYHKDMFYVLRSDGDIYSFPAGNAKAELVKTETHLNDKNDTEGLCVDDEHDRLLILCKEKPGKTLKKKEVRSIYSYNINEGKVEEQPLFLIDVKKIKSVSKKKKFKPAAIAYHHIRETYFIIGSVNALLVELSSEGEMLNLYNLSSSVLPQPEGLTFDKEGNMYVSSEGTKNQKARIVKYNYVAN